jgi:hypothetical protein
MNAKMNSKTYLINMYPEILSILFTLASKKFVKSANRSQPSLFLIYQYEYQKTQYFMLVSKLQKVSPKSLEGRELLLTILKDVKKPHNPWTFVLEIFVIGTSLFSSGFKISTICFLISTLDF